MLILILSGETALDLLSLIAVLIVDVIGIGIGIGGNDNNISVHELIALMLSIIIAISLVFDILRWAWLHSFFDWFVMNL